MEHQYVLDFLRENPTLISFEALIGAGKSTLCTSIHRVVEKYNTKSTWYPEPIINDLLNLFYTDKKKYAFSFQSIIIRERVHVLLDAWNFVKTSGGFATIDRSRYGDFSFALMHLKNGNISPDEFAVYTKLVGDTSGRYKHGDVNHHVVYLDCTPEKCRERIIKRGNQEEVDGCPLDYLRELEFNYLNVLKNKNLNELEIITLNEISKSCPSQKIIFIDYNLDLNINSEGYIEESQVFKILYDIIKQIQK